MGKLCIFVTFGCPCLGLTKGFDTPQSPAMKAHSVNVPFMISGNNSSKLHYRNVTNIPYT